MSELPHPMSPMLMNNQITYCLSHFTYKYALDAAMPAHTLAWLLEQVHLHLLYLRDTNSEIFFPNQFATPAATIWAFINGAIGVHLPSRECWIQAYSNDAEWVPSATSCSILPKLIHPHSMQLTSIIAPLYGNLKL
jgi:hypothetical protein